MFPSANCYNPFDQSSFKRSSFPSDQNPSSKQDDPPFLFNFPSPFFDEHELPLNQILFQNHLMAGNDYLADQTTDISTNPTNRDATKGNIEASSKVNEKEAYIPIPPLRRRNLGAIPRRRAGKKDRHSKICTAQGIRDRRMRLSLQVARKFFDLQDMLGYDKASQTIEWLFNQSKRAIKELVEEHPEAYNMISTGDAKSESFLSECEVVSGVEEISNNDVKEIILPSPNSLPLCINNHCEKDVRKVPQKPACKSNMRESRDKARARARCRTREKMMIKRIENSIQKWCKSNTSDDDNLHKLGSLSSPFEGVDQESNSHNQERVNPLVGVCTSLEYQLADVGTIEKLLGNSSSSTISCHNISDYHCSPAAPGYYIDPHSSFMGFLGNNWDLLNNTDRTNSINYGVTNQVSVAGNPNSIYSAPP